MIGPSFRSTSRARSRKNDDLDTISLNDVTTSSIVGRFAGSSSTMREMSGSMNDRFVYTFNTN